MSARALDFFFDLASPYSYLAATQLGSLAARTGAEVNLRPMVLFGVFKATGNDMPARIAAKAKYMMADLARWVRQYGVPFTMNSRFPMNTVRLMRLCIAGDQEGQGMATTLAAFSSMWAEDLDPTADDTVRAVARKAGLDPERALKAVEDPAVKDRLRTYTDEAIARGAFGAPAMFVGQELFWGNDRLHHVEAALKAR